MSMNDKMTYWEALADDSRPKVLYGTGNGADKIIDALSLYGVSVDGVFASNGFVRSRTFRDMPVLSYDQAKAEFGDNMIVLPAFGTTLPDVMEFFKYLDVHHEVIIPEVPLYGGGIFDSAYVSENREALEKVYGMLSDDVSREIFENVVSFRMTGKMQYLYPCESMRETLHVLLGEENIKVALDGGAYKGDSAADMLASLPHVEKIYACEPDPSTFKKLTAFAESEDVKGRVVPVEAALSDRCGVAESVASGSRGSGVEGRNKRAKIREIKLDTVDNILAGERVDYIKLDVEGAELEAICGASETLEKYRPIVSASLYHRTGDLISLPLVLAEKLGNVKMYLRRPECIPMWDLNLYVLPQHD